MIRDGRSLRQDILYLALEDWRNSPGRTSPSLLEGQSFLEWFINESRFIKDEVRSPLYEAVWSTEGSPQQMDDIAEWLIVRSGAINSDWFTPEVYPEVIQKRSTPQPDEHWQHNKQEDDQYYVIVGTAQLSQVWFDTTGLEELVLYAKTLTPILHELATTSNFVIQHTEIDELFVVTREKNLGWILRPNINPLTGKALVRNPVAWGRPLSNFMGVVTTEPTHFYRFNKL